MPLSSDDKNILLALAQSAIREQLDHPGKPPFSVNPNNYSTDLQTYRASFVTLTKTNELRGCIGSLQAHLPLVLDVINNARAAAFSDPRFLPVTIKELDAIKIHISVLSEAEPMHFTSEANLLEQIRPGIDGLILEDDDRHGTFLPSVWESLPTPEQFLQHLKLKANLPAGYWSDSIKVSRYTTESFS